VETQLTSPHAVDIAVDHVEGNEGIHLGDKTVGETQVPTLPLVGTKTSWIKIMRLFIV
jgi:hypothetical protein